MVAEMAGRIKFVLPCLRFFFKRKRLLSLRTMKQKENEEEIQYIMPNIVIVPKNQKPTNLNEKKNSFQEDSVNAKDLDLNEYFMIKSRIRSL